MGNILWKKDPEPAIQWPLQPRTLAYSSFEQNELGIQNNQAESIFLEENQPEKSKNLRRSRRNLFESSKNSVDRGSALSIDPAAESKRLLELHTENQKQLERIVNILEKQRLILEKVGNQNENSRKSEEDKIELKPITDSPQSISDPQSVEVTNSKRKRISKARKSPVKSSKKHSPQKSSAEKEIEPKGSSQKFSSRKKSAQKGKTQRQRSPKKN